MAKEAARSQEDKVAVDLVHLNAAARWLGVGRNRDPDRHNPWNPQWTEGLIAVLGSQWDASGMTKAASDKFRAGLVVQTCLAGCCMAWNGNADILPGAAVDASILALPMLSSELGEKKACSAISKAASKCSDAMLAAAGPGASQGQTPTAAVAVLSALAKAGGAAVAVQIGKRLMLAKLDYKRPASEWGSQQSIADLYAELFAQGLSLSDFWNLSPKPGRSPSDQARAIIETMAPGPLKGVFVSFAEAKEIKLSMAGAPMKGSDAWLAKGLEPQDAGFLANLVDQLDALHPGSGAKLAVAWLRQHPELKESFDAGSQSLKAPRKAGRL